MKHIIEKLKSLDKKDQIVFITQFGSTVKNRHTPLSDVDIAVYFDGTKKERFDFRVKALGELPDKVDLQIFQDLPLSIQKEVLKGKLLYSRSFKQAFDIYIKVIKEFDSFERYYLNYLQELERGVLIE